MVTGFDSRVSSFISELQLSKFVGTWIHDLTADQVIFDESAAVLMTGDRELADNPISLTHACRCLHPDDRVWLLPKISAISLEGGDFIADYRINSKKGVRRVLDKGRIHGRPDGSLQGFGILLDITDISCAQLGVRAVGNTSSSVDLLSDLSRLQDLLGGSSHRTKTLFDMLRVEIKRSSI